MRMLYGKQFTELDTMTRPSEFRMTTHSAVARLATLASLLICGVTCLATGPQAFYGGTVVLMLIALSAGLIFPTLDGRGVLRTLGILSDGVIVAFAWWLAFETLLGFAGGAASFSVVFFVALFVYAFIAIVLQASLSSSSSFREFACIEGRADHAPYTADEPRSEYGR